MGATGIDVATFPTTVWDVLTAIGTAGAVLVSLLFAAVETQRRKKAEKARDVAEANQHKVEKQALIAKVAVWHDVFLVEPTAGESGDGPPLLAERLRLTIYNHSDLPIFDVLPGFSDGGDVKLSAHLHDLDSHGRGPTTVRLMPGESITVEVPPSQPDGSPIGSARALFAFRDVRGDWWARDWSGTIIDLVQGA